MMKRSRNPFKNLVLDAYEKEIEEAIERDKVRPIKDQARHKRLYQKYAKYTLEKLKNINIRVTQKDLLYLRAKAAEEGIPYQTLAASILHRFVSK